MSQAFALPATGSAADLALAAARPGLAAGLRRGLLETGIVLVGSLLLAASARAIVPLPLAVSPVPVTGQTFMLLLLAALLGPHRAAAVVLAYLAEGAAGLPVFAGGGFGLAQLAGPTGGYLVGFLPAAVLVGCLAERGWDRRLGTTLAAMALGTLVVLGLGAAWLGTLIGFERALAAGVLPFLPGAVLKIAAAAALLPAGWRMLPRARRD